MLKSLRSSWVFWFALSLTFGAVYALMALPQAFAGEYVVQDDARQHVFWMQRFLDPDLFPNDLIAEYFQSVAPWGYGWLYQGFALLGVDPLLLHKLLPVGLSVATAGFCFGVCWQMLPVPVAGFMASLLLEQCLWMQDGLISATPKAFVYPLFLAFLYFFLQRKLWFTLTAIALLGLFYPQYVLIAAGMLGLQLVGGQPWRDRREVGFCLMGMAVAIAILLPYALTTSAFDPTVTAAVARTMPEFLPKGRTVFFQEDPWEFWFTSRGGIRLSLEPLLLCAGLLLPVLLRFPNTFPLAKQVAPKVSALATLLLSAFGVFFLAHAVLFRLHLPSRYTQHSFRLAIALAAGIALTLLLDALWQWGWQRGRGWQRAIALGIALAVGAQLLGFPATIDTFPWTGYVTGDRPALYAFLQQQPKDILVASLAPEADNLPTFAERSVLVAGEYAIPYQLGYFDRFRQRTNDLIQAQYSGDAATVQAFTQQYGIDFWLVERHAFVPDYLRENRWLRQYEAATEAAAFLEAGGVPVLVPLLERCAVFQEEPVIVLEAACVAGQGKH